MNSEIYPKMHYDNVGNTVTNQPGAGVVHRVSNANKNEWSNQLWDVCEDIPECLCATFIPICHLYSLYSKVDEGKSVIIIIINWKFLKFFESINKVVVHVFLAVFYR